MIAFYNFRGLRPRGESMRDSLTAWVKRNGELIRSAEAQILRSRKCLDWAQREIVKLCDKEDSDE